MSSKKAHSAKDSNRENIPEVLCDENWKCDVIFIYEGDGGGQNLINTLLQIPTNQITGGIKVINKNDLLKDLKKFDVKSSKKPTPKDDKNKVEVQLTDEQIIMKCVKEQTEIPGKSLAKIVNKRLLQVKFENTNEKKKQSKLHESSKKKKGKSDDKNPDDKNENETEPPPLFIILLGFNEYDLPLELIKLHVPMRAVVKITTKIIENVVQQSFVVRNLSSTKFNMTWLNFWRRFQTLMNTPENVDYGTDLPTMNYNFSEEFDAKANIKDKKTNAINQLTSIMNYVRNILERYELYFQSLSPIDLNDDLIIEDPNLYETLMKTIPLECVSIPLILFAIIEQVCHWNGDGIEIENIDEDGSSSVSTPIKKYTKCTPAIIRHNDVNSLKTFHLDVPEIDFDKIIIRFLSKSFLFKPWQENKKDQMREYFFEFHLQRLWKLTNKDIHLKLFYIYLHWYIICRIKTLFKLSLKIDENAQCTNNAALAFNYSSYYNHYLQDWIKEFEANDQNLLTERTSQVSCDYNMDTKDYNNINVTNNQNSDMTNNEGSIQSEIEDEQPRIEHGKTVEMIKMQRKHNLKILKNFLHCSEISCLRESNEFPLFINNLKQYTNYKYIEEMAPLSLLQSIHEALTTYSKVHSIYYYPSNKILLWFQNCNACITEEFKTGVLDTALGLRDYYTKFVEPEEEALKKNAQLNDDDSKTYSEIINDLEDVYVEKISPIYNIGKKLVKYHQVLRRSSSKDGTNVTVKVEDWYLSSQYTHICIHKIEIDMNIYIDKLLHINYNNEDPKTEPIETLKLFVTFPNGTILRTKVQEIMENNTSNFIFSDLTITLPTGLIIEPIKNTYNNNDIYIKQTYTAKGPNCNKIWNEKCRCYDRTGTVVIFKYDGTISVIYGNTTMASINQVQEIIPELNIIPEVIQEELPKKRPKDKKGAKPKEIIIEPIIEPPEDKEFILPYGITEHSIQSWSGKVYYYKDTLGTEIMNDINLRTYFKPNEQLYVERNDGVRSFLQEDSTLVSTYDDGTILTVYAYEEPEEDKEKHNPMNEKYVKPTELNDEELDAKSDTIFSKFKEMIEGSEEFFEMFTSYKIGSTFEHPNFVKVEFIPRDDSVKLLLPDGILINIHDIQNGTYDITVDVEGKTQLIFSKEFIEFKSNILKNKSPNITTVLPIITHSSSSSINSDTDYYFFCKTKDSFGRTLLVNKSGDVKLQDPYDLDEKCTNVLFNFSNNYYDSNVPNKMTERFFVVNDNMSGYEIISQSDSQLLDLDDKKRFMNVDVTKNPTNNRISSKTSQYYIFKTYSEQFLFQLNFNDCLPKSFQRTDLSPPWTPDQSPWLLCRHDPIRVSYRTFSYTDIHTHTDSRIQAVVIKTIQQVSDTNDWNSLDIIFNCLEKYKKENEKLLVKYKGQGYTDLQIDSRLKENYEIISSIKKELPLWNVLRKECKVCKQSFGCPMRRVESVLLTNSSKADEKAEKLLNKVDYT